MRHLILSLVFIAAACGKKDPAPQPTAAPAATTAPAAKPEPKPEPAPEARPEAGAVAGADAPEKVLAMFYPALRKPDAEVLWALTAEEARTQLQGLLDKAKSGEMKLPEEFGVAGADVASMTVRDLFAGIAKANADRQKERLAHEPTDSRVEVVEEGKRATIFYKLGPAHCELSVTKEADGWKIANETCTEGG